MIVIDILQGLVIISFLGAGISMFLRIILGYMMLWHFKRDILKNPLKTLNDIFINTDNIIDDKGIKYQHYIDFFSKCVVYFLCISFGILAIIMISAFFLMLV